MGSTTLRLVFVGTIHAFNLIKHRYHWFYGSYLTGKLGMAFFSEVFSQHPYQNCHPETLGLCHLNSKMAMIYRAMHYTKRSLSVPDSGLEG